MCDPDACARSPSVACSVPRSAGDTDGRRVGRSRIQLERLERHHGSAGLPKPIVAKLHDAIAKALASPDVKELFAAQGAEPFSDTPEQFAQHVRNEYVRFGKAVKDAGLKVE